MRQIVEKITDKPVVVLITHVDGDHIHCLGQFEEAWMSPSEYARFHNDTGTNPNLHPIWDGDIFDLGGVKLEAVMNPGHTSGCCIRLGGIDFLCWIITGLISLPAPMLILTCRQIQLKSRQFFARLDHREKI